MHAQLGPPAEHRTPGVVSPDEFSAHDATWQFIFHGQNTSGGVWPRNTAHAVTLPYMSTVQASGGKSIFARESRATPASRGGLVVVPPVAAAPPVVITPPAAAVPPAPSAVEDARAPPVAAGNVAPIDAPPVAPASGGGSMPVAQDASRAARQARFFTTPAPAVSPARARGGIPPPRNLGRAPASSRARPSTRRRRTGSACGRSRAVHHRTI